MATMRPGGSGWRVAVGAPYVMAGKTGTAQVISRKGTAALNPRNLPMHLRHRALFVGFAPAEDPVIAIAIAVEGGGYGGSAAAPIARKVFDAWLLGVMPDGLQPLDAERGTVVVGVATFDTEDATWRARGEQVAPQFAELPVMIGTPVPPSGAPGIPPQPAPDAMPGVAPASARQAAPTATPMEPRR